MLVSVLASGSEGNCTYVETDSVKLLIDVGMNLKYITEKLSELNVKPSEIDYIFITHIHTDHIGALKTFIKKYTPNVVVTKSMYEDLEILNCYEKTVITDELVAIGSTVVENFKTSHDTSDSRGFLIYDDTSSLVYITDTGYINQKYFKKLYNKNLYIIEANHDVEMLLNGNHPKWLKDRVCGDNGHLSNNAAGFYLSKLIGPDTKKVILAHLSHENNEEQIAVSTVKKTLVEYSIDFCDITVAHQRDKLEEIKL